MMGWRGQLEKDGLKDLVGFQFCLGKRLVHVLVSVIMFVFIIHN